MSGLLFYLGSVLTTWSGILGWAGVATGILLLVKWRVPQYAAKLERLSKGVELLFAGMLVVVPYLVWRDSALRSRHELGQARDSLRAAVMSIEESKHEQRQSDSLRTATALSTRAVREREVVRQLAAFVREGESIKDKCLHGPYRPIDDSANWNRRVRAFLGRELGDAYVVRFDQAQDRSGMGFDGVNIAMSALWHDVDAKQSCLAEFLRELTVVGR